MVSTTRINPNNNTDLQVVRLRPNPIIGEIISLSYQGNGNHLVEIKVQEFNSGNIFTLTAFCNVNLDFSTIKITNLNDFGFRLQEAYNNLFSVSIFSEEENIVLLEINRRAITAKSTIRSPGTNGGG